MTEIYVPDGRSGYREILKHVIRNGERSSPRGMPTLDAGEVTIVLESPYNALPLSTGRNVSQRIAAAEAIQLIGGFSLPELLPPSFDRFKEDDGSFYGAYGVRIGNQLAKVIRKLQSDRDSRQAVITLWDPNLDNIEPPKRDHPCTVALGFRIYRDQLRARVLMRSSDAWLGIPYDMMQFTQLQLTLARLLNVEPGPYTHMTWSLHLYEQHLALADCVHPPVADTFQPSGIGNDTTNTVSSVRRRAWSIAHSHIRHTSWTDSERWYVAKLKS